MGWGLFKSKKRESPVFIRIDELDKKLSKLKSEQLEEVRRNLSGYLEGVRRERGRILKALEELSKAETSEEIHPGLYKSALEARRLLVEKLTRPVSDLSIHDISSLDEVLSIRESLGKIANSTSESIFAHGRRAGAVFSKEVKLVRSALRDFHQAIKETVGVINSLTPRMELITQLSARLGSYQALKEEQKELSDRIQELKRRREELEKTISQKRKDLESFKASTQYQRTEELSREMKEIERKISETKRAFEAELSKLNRALRKIERFLEHRKEEMSKDRKILLRVLIHEPLGVLETEEKARAAQALLTELLPLMDEIEIEKDPNEQSKVLSIFQRMVAEDFFTRFYGKLQQLEREKNQVLGQWEDEPGLKLARMEEEIKRFEVEQSRLLQEIQTVERKLQEEGALRELEKEMQEIAEKLSIKLTFS